jgi:hypothetical protein
LLADFRQIPAAARARRETGTLRQPGRRVPQLWGGEQMMFRKLLSITFLLALPLITVVAQQKPNFSGTWKLNVAKSDFGMLGGPTSRTDVITHKDPSLSDSVSGESAEGKQQYTATYTTDEKEAQNKIGGRDVKTTVKWDGNKLVFTSKLVYEGADVTGTAIWTLSEDGKTLTLAVHYTSAMGDADQKLVFEKE